MDAFIPMLLLLITSEQLNQTLEIFDVCENGFGCGSLNYWVSSL